MKQYIMFDDSNVLIAKNDADIYFYIFKVCMNTA